MCDFYDNEEEFIYTSIYFGAIQEDLVSLLKDTKEYSSFIVKNNC